MRKKLLVLAGILLGGLSAAAQESQTLDSITVTANKLPQPLAQIGKAVTIIDQQTIGKSSGKTLPQLLNEQTGIIINGALNNLGSVQTVYTRGGNSGRTLILIDGLPVSDPSMINNEFDLNLIAMNEVERIEIYRGAQSVLYGSDAVAGVINIITINKSIDKAFNAKLGAGYGNLNTFRGNAQVYGKLGRLHYSAKYAHLRSNGFSSAHDDTGKGDFDDDGYRGHTTGAQLTYTTASPWTLKSFIRYSKYKTDADGGTFTDDKDYTIKNSNLLTGAGFEFKENIFHFVGNYQYGEVSRNYLNDSTDKLGFEKNRYKGITQFGEFYGTAAFTKWLTLLAGVDYRWGNMNQDYLSISSFGPYTTQSDSNMHQTSAYASLFLNALNKRFHFEIGGRYNTNSNFGNSNTYTINPSFIINQHFTVFAGLSTGFKTPSIYQLFDASSGNQQLKAEESKNYEAGLRFQKKSLHAAVNYFERKINNGIDFDYVNWKYFNFVSQHVKGLETEWQYRPVNNINITANYTFMDAKEMTQSRITTQDTTYHYALRRPKHNLNISVGYNYDNKLHLSVSGKYTSKRMDTGGYQVADARLGDYFLLGAYGEYLFTEKFKIFVDAQNILNRTFFDVRGYNAIPTMVNGGITIHL